MTFIEIWFRVLALIVLVLSALLALGGLGALALWILGPAGLIVFAFLAGSAFIAYFIKDAEL